MELFGIKVLESDWIDPTDESVQFNNVVFLFESLSKYNGMTVEILHDWEVKIRDEKSNVIDKF